MDRCRARGLVALAALAALASSAGCTSAHNPPPSQLVDGTKARVPPVRLDAPMPQILTTVASTRADDLVAGGAADECLRVAREHEAAGPIVVRTGISGLSVTFGTASGRALVACDASHAISASDTSWCGRAYGRLEGGRLLDPRLDVVGCTTPTGDVIAFAWIVPARATAYLAVGLDGYTEVYPTADGLPVRVTSGSVSPDRSGASFDVFEHSANGTLLRSSTIDVRVAG